MSLDNEHELVGHLNVYASFLERVAHTGLSCEERLASNAFLHGR